MSEIWRGLWFRARYRDILHRQSLDALGNHRRHFGLAVRDLLRAVPGHRAGVVGSDRSAWNDLTIGR